MHDVSQSSNKRFTLAQLMLMSWKIEERRMDILATISEEMCYWLLSIVEFSVAIVSKRDVVER